MRHPVAWIALGAIMIGSMPSTGGSQSQDTIGSVAFHVSCDGPVQQRFDRAVALLHHMTYARARAEFTAIASSDPECAMAHWGIAMTLFQPLWPTRPSEADLERGREAIARARELGAGTERERLHVAAAGAFFDAEQSEYWDRIARWADATRVLYERFPDDPESAVFFALAHLAVAPARSAGNHNEESAAVLQSVLRVAPDHPGAVHYMIHASDADGREGESLGVVRNYTAIAPKNPHALHMPTHIYVRLGDWAGVIEGNLQAALAALETPAGDQGQWVWDEFPHAIEYLVYAYLQIGDDSSAQIQMTRLQQTAHLEPSFKTAFNLSSIPARIALERRNWAEAVQLLPRPDPTLPWDRFPWPEAVTWYARGIGAARLGDTLAAHAAEHRLHDLRDASNRLGEDLFARQTEILRLGVSAWLAHARSEEERAIGLMREALALETDTPKHPVTPAPTLPAAELLGDLLLELARPEAALEAYELSLRRTPNRFNSLVGAARAADRAGDVERALEHYRRLLAIVVSGSMRPEVTEAERYLDRHGGSVGASPTGSETAWHL
jgi:tetratricopeptide (TPR) repeat protein